MVKFREAVPKQTGCCWDSPLLSGWPLDSKFAVATPPPKAIRMLLGQNFAIPRPSGWPWDSKSAIPKPSGWLWDSIKFAIPRPSGCPWDSKFAIPRPSGCLWDINSPSHGHPDGFGTAQTCPDGHGTTGCPRDNCLPSQSHPDTFGMVSGCPRDIRRLSRGHPDTFGTAQMLQPKAIRMALGQY